MEQKDLELRSNSYYILLALCDAYLHTEEQTLHGYGVRTKAKELSQNEVTLPTASIYQNLSRFMEIGAITMDEKDGQKLYRLTEQGLLIAIRERDRLRKISEDATTILGK